MSALLIDIGNSRIKYAQYTAEKGLSEVLVANDVMEVQLAAIESDKVLLASVANNTLNQQVKDVIAATDTRLEQIHTQASALGVSCAYDNFHTLGVDRWLGVLAASDKIPADSQQCAAVISVGTAITCDFVQHKKHLGGWIAPGFELMRNAVTQNTARVFGKQSFPESLQIGGSTPDCVNYGCLAALQGLLLVARQQLADINQDQHIYITGGGQSAMADIATDQATFIPNMVLEGLALFL